MTERELRLAQKQHWMRLNDKDIGDVRKVERA